ncbi:restriction endonuclease subunit S [Microcoleus sp. PH2017_30_WIL_O_A]|uniref:restriction endonuclease subunit S n=1 Tax=Microcoleus sp. PH2017_30_WIL_O_A TaxID=2798840 RepID=UPI001D663C3A|nr:restriction endonuclease subunit S [Microcoleus sp. PH2017_30_WIL_O_A]MCC3588008.1 restriction endonuclease subunit S [Microcoleus sp. PH2017_30_WIL_O_A]
MSSAWKKIAIGDVVDSVKTWNPLRSLRDDSFDYVDLSAIDQDSKTIIGVRKVVCGDAPSRARQLVVKGDVLVSTVRPNLNGVALVPEELDGATASTGFCVLRPRKDFLDGTYLFHWVKSPNFISDMVKKATGANYPAVSDRIISESQIPLPPLEEQRRIAEILDRAQSLISKRREAIGQLDILTKAIFLEMFGDPVTNPKEFTIRKIKDLLESASYGTSEKSSFEGKFPVLRMNNITRTGEIDLTDLKYMDLADSQKERYLVRSGDVLFNRTNSAELVGKTAIIRNISNPMAFAGYLVRLRVNKENDQFMLLEAIGSKYLGKDGQTLGTICKQISFPHSALKEALSKIYGFASDYPGIRHGGNPDSAIRDIDMREMVVMSILLAGFTPYLTNQINADVVYRGEL